LVAGQDPGGSSSMGCEERDIYGLGCLSDAKATIVIRDAELNKLLVCELVWQAHLVLECV
jgi:hypothetical protein